MKRLAIFVFGLLACTMNGQTEKKFLEAYSGQTVDELIAMESEYRVDSLVLAFEEAIRERKGGIQLTQVEMDILAVEAMEREVNNGGYDQFFWNSSRRFAAVLPSALRRIGCPKAADLADEALACLKIEGEITAAKVRAAVSSLDDERRALLGKIDFRYYEGTEAIADQLFLYIKTNRSEIRLK